MNFTLHLTEERHSHIERECTSVRAYVRRILYELRINNFTYLVFLLLLFSLMGSRPSSSETEIIHTKSIQSFLLITCVLCTQNSLKFVVELYIIYVSLYEKFTSIRKTLVNDCVVFFFP